MFQHGSNRFEVGLRGIPKIALEFNLVGGWVSFQTALMAPGKVTFDDRSDAVKGLVDATKGREVRYDWGLTLGASFLDGSLSLGYGWLKYDRRDFKQYAELVELFPDSSGKGPARRQVSPPRVKSSLFRDSFLYAALQPLSGIRSGIKNSKEAANP
jgi:hypothetical protein